MTLQEIQLPVLDTDPEPEGSRWAKAHHILLGFLTLAAAVWLLSGFYKVNADEVAIVERLGQFISTSDGKAVLVEQGLHYRIPWPIDTVFKIPVQQTRTLTVDQFFAPQQAFADYKRDLMRQYPWVTPDLLGAIFDPYLITADKNVVHMSVVVTYRIDDPEAWVMTVAHDAATASADATSTSTTTDAREKLLQQIVQHTIIQQIAKVPVERVLFAGSDQLSPMLTAAVQKAMTLGTPDPASGVRPIDLGVQVQKADVVASRWPQYQTVDEAFQNVLKARSDADSARFAAHADADSAVTQAQSQKDTMQREAEAYKKQVTDEAKGEASRFSQVFAQYQKAPDVTRWNVYAEAVKAVSGAAKRMLFVEPGQKTILTIDPPQFDVNQVQNGNPQGNPGR